MAPITSRDLARYALTLRYEDLGNTTVLAVKKHLIDTLACALGGAGAHPVTVTLNMLRDRGEGGPARAWVTGERLPADMAALLNGTMIRYLDLNDVYVGAGGLCHPGDHFGPLLAAAEAYGASGRELIVAAVIAYEIQGAMCDLISGLEAGVDQATYALYSMTASIGRLMWLTEDQLVNALGLCASAHNVLRTVRKGTISEFKGAAVGNAGRNAIFCCLWAKAGMTGPAGVMEGTHGFYYWLGHSLEFELAMSGDGFRLTRSEIKLFPLGYHGQVPVSAALALQAEHRFTHVEIKGIEVVTYATAMEAMGDRKEFWQPATRETADHSIPYAVCSALVAGRLTAREFQPRALTNPATLKLLANFTLTADPILSREYPGKNPVIVRIALKDGRNLERREDYYMGHYERPLSKEQAEAKLRGLASGVLPENQIEALTKAVWQLELQESCLPLVDSMIQPDR